MNRRAFLSAAAVTTAAALMPFPVIAQQSAYPHRTLDSTTLAQYPDNQKTIHDLLSSAEFSGKYVILELVAGWCPHCARQKPEMDAALEKLSAEGASIARLTVYYEEGTPNPPTRGAAAYRNAVGSMLQSGGFPEVHIWKDGVPIGHMSGARSSDQIERILRQNLPDLFPSRSAPAPANP